MKLTQDSFADFGIAPAPGSGGATTLSVGNCPTVTRGEHRACSGPWHKQDILVIPGNVRLPSRCIKCNTPTSEPPIVLHLKWQPPFVLSFCFGSFFKILNLAGTWQAHLHVSLCAKHQAERKRWDWIFFLVGISGLLSFILGFLTGHVGFCLGIFASFAAIMLAPKAQQVLRLKWIDDHQNLWLKGAARDYLHSLPEWAGDAPWQPTANPSKAPPKRIHQ